VGNFSSNVEDSEGVEYGAKVSCAFCGAKRGQSASNGDWIAGQKIWLVVPQIMY
jgi:hypothetical protein